MRRIISAALVFGAITTGAFATEIDFSAVPLNETGKPFTNCKELDVSNPQDPKCKNMVDLNLATMALLALNATEANLTPEELTRRGQLAIRIANGGKQDLAVDEIKMIRDLMAKRSFAPIAYVRAMEILDPASLKK